MNITNDALDKLMGLYHEHSHEVGSMLKKEYPYEYENLKSTDCITYVINVLSYAFEQTNNMQAVNKVRALGAYGTKLANYLVEEQNFKAIYINPDIYHPNDSDEEHTYSAYVARNKCTYYDIKLKYQVVNYNPTSRDDLSFQSINTTKGTTPLDEISIEALSNVEFGFGVSRGGRHTWLFSYGKVYEVHWNNVGADLYEASPLQSYNWLSGVIVIPKEQEVYLENIDTLGCYKI